MDLLGSILGEMSGPPSSSASEKARRRKERELVAKMEEKKKEEMSKFRTKMESIVHKFIQSKDRRLDLEPMGKWERSVIHDVSEVADLLAHSFGDESNEERHVIVWKKETPPCEDELDCCRKGRTWDPVANAKEKEEEALLRAEESALEASRSAEARVFVPKGPHYQSKYEHLIGSEAALEAARKTEMNKSYGMVSSEMKKDKRSVEDIQSEIREKKRKRMMLEQRQEGQLHTQQLVKEDLNEVQTPDNIK